ncbi:MAG: hypothetical protein ACFFCT_07075 [Candidatus Odinarchaeota archaeon]
MDLLEACLHANGREAVKAVRSLLPSVRTSAIWAIIMHAAAWHEERTFDTSHATISVYTTHRMIESLGRHATLVSEKPIAKRVIDLPDDQTTSLQEMLIERLAYHIADTDHWRLEQGPRYDIETRLDSRGNAVQVYVQSIRERVQMSALKAAAVLGARADQIMLIRATASIAAEEPDKLGHTFIMPMSLVTELPASEYTRPHIASLWHLTEFLVRKVPSKVADEFGMDDKIGKFAKPTELSSSRNLFMNAVVNYGTLGHNAIFAHRISEAARLGLVNGETIQRLLLKLQRNIGIELENAEDTSFENIVKKLSGVDWSVLPTEISLPSSRKVSDWFITEHGDLWDSMHNLTSSAFENMIMDSAKQDWPIIRAMQYTMAAIRGDIEEPHPLIFTQAVWGLVDNGLVPESLAALQVHRLLREQMKDK